MRNISKISLLILMFVLAAASVSAVSTFATPTSGGTVGGIYNFNVTADLNNITNCNISGSSTLTADSFTRLALYNISPSLVNANKTNQTIGWIDSDDWVLTGTCVNLTGNTSSITSITVTVDNQVPTCTVAGFLASSSTYAPTQTFAVTGGNATSATVQFGGNARLTMSETSSNSDNFSYTGVITEGTYSSVTFRTSDGTNVTTCSLTYVEIDSDSTTTQVGMLYSEAARNEESDLSTAELLAILAVVVVVAAKAKGKGKK